MAVRQDQVQIQIDFITDESRQLAKTLLTTKEYNKEIAASTAKIAEYQKQLAKAGTDEKKRADLLAKIAVEEKKVADGLTKIAAEGKKVESLDLGKVAPAQLVERAKQLAQAMRLIPQSNPQFKVLQDELAKVNTQLRQVNQTAKGINAPGGGGGGLFGSLAAGASRFVGIAAIFETLKTAITGANALEQLNISFEVFLGNAEKAKEVVLELRQFADVTPFETEQVNKAGRSLLAFGITADELIPTLTKIGDIAAGTGKDFNELAIIYGKARTEGLIQNDTLNQLAEAGIPIYEELAKVLNVNQSQIRKLAEQGKIQFSDLQKSFENLTGEGSKFGGLMEKQSQSLGGLWSTLKSQFTNFITEFGTALAPLVKRGLEILIFGMEMLGKVVKPVLDLYLKGYQAIADASRQAASFFSNDLPAAIGKSVNAAEELPIIGKGISALLIPIRLIIDAFESLSATAEGAMAALTDIFTTGGANAGKAYSEARQKALEEERAEERRAAAEAARDDRQLTEKEQRVQAELEKRQAAERAAAEKKAREERQKFLDAALQTALKAVEVATKREELLLENKRIKGEVDERTYLERMSQINERGLNARMQVFRDFHREQVNEALELQNQLAEIQAGRGLRNAAPTATLPGRGPGQVESQTDEDAQLGPLVPTVDALQARFAALYSTEQAYLISKGELESAYYAEQLARLEAAGKQETDEYKRIAEKKKAADQSVADNKQQLVDFQARLEEAQQAVFSESINLAVTLLAKDAAARRKHASAIKAFQIGEVLAFGIAEIQKIYSKFSALPFGAIIAQPEIIAAGLRTAGAVAKIAIQKFYYGGPTGPGYGAPDETGHRPAGIVHANEWVAPEWMVNNPATSPVIRWLEGKRLRGFAEGGLVTVNTTPSSLPSMPAAAAPVLGGVEQFTAAVDRFTVTVAGFPKEVKSRVVYTEIEEVGSELNSVRDDAAI